MATDPKIPPRKKTTFGQPPEKRNWYKTTVQLCFIVLAVVLIVWMIAANPRQHSLSCRQYTGAGSWSSFGRCTED